MSESQGFLEELRKEGYNVKDLCRGDGLLSDVFRVVASRSLQGYLNVCLSPTRPLQAEEPRAICAEDGNFDCGVLETYKDFARLDRECAPSSDVPPCPSGPGAATGLLVGLTLAGFLLGCLLTSCLCIVFPALHRWASSKIRGGQRKTGDTLASAGQSRSAIPSEEYQDFDKQLSHRQPREAIPLPDQPPDSEPGDTVQSATDLHLPQSGVEEVNSDGEYAALDYEPLTRNDSSQQSHKYARIRGTEGTEHDAPSRDCEYSEDPDIERAGERTAPEYFILEKTGGP